MASENRPPRKFELPSESFAELADRLDAHVEYAASRGVNTSISIQNGFHFKTQPSEHEVVDLGEQQETFAASQAKLAVVAFKLVQGSLDKDTRHDIIFMLRISDNGAFIRQKRNIGHEVVDFARSELNINTNILIIRDDETSYVGKTTARDSLKMFLKTVQIAHKDADFFHDIRDALSDNTSKYGVRARLLPNTGVYLMNKTGDYFGQDDPDIGEAVHHDVGVLATIGKNKRRLAYSITSSAQSRMGAWNADRLNQLAATTLIEAVGGTPKSALMSALGAVATKILPK
ncbi:MAG: hypothetical protein ABIR46_04340 [Candidatus Saccharimonadales bacterium]